MYTKSGIQATGSQTDLLQQHQSRGGAARLPSHTRLRIFRDAPYSASQSSRTTSVHTTSQASQSILGDGNNNDTASLTRSKGRNRAPRGTHHQGECSIKDFDEETQEIIEYSRAFIIDDMFRKVGWCAEKKGRTHRLKSAWECFLQATIALGKGDKGEPSPPYEYFSVSLHISQIFNAPKKFQPQ